MFSYDGTHLGSIGKIVAEKWNNDEIDDSPGEKDILIGRGVLLKLGEEIGMGRPVDVRAKVAVERNYFFGKLSVHLKGLKDLQKGGVITREFITDSIEPARIEQGLVEGWKKIDSEEQLSVRPVLDLSVKDYLPIEEISNIGAKES